MKHYDVAIIGGGLVGTSLAIALQNSNLRVALVDARLPTNDDPRIFALNEASCQFLTNLGLWDALAEFATPIHQVHVSQQGKFGAVRLNREDVAVSALGHVIPAKHVEQALNDHATVSFPRRRESIQMDPRLRGDDTNPMMYVCDIYRPAKLIECNPGYYLTLDTDETITTTILIGADGTNSTVRELLKINTTTHDYHQQAIVARITLQRSHHNVAYERFTTDGAIAMLPLTNNECAMIWSADQDHAQSLMSLSDSEFLQTLQQAFGYRLGRFVAMQQRYQFPLRNLQAEKSVVGNAMLIGNAAHTLHPIAAQGFNIALQEVAALTEALIANQENLPSLNLQNIQEATQKYVNNTAQVSHRLSTLFAGKSALKSILLQMGMTGFDITTPLKQKFIQGMMGRTNSVSRLLLRANET